MSTIFAEQPLLLSLMVAAIAGGLLFSWMQTGQKVLIISGLLIACMIPLFWVIASQLETDREQILAIVYDTATAVQQNDHDTAVKVIGDEPTKQQARAELPKYVFEKVSVSGVEIKIIPGSFPKEADVDMIATVIASDKRGQFKNMRAIRRIILTLEKTPDDRWVVVDYNHTPLNGQADAYSPQTVVTSRLNVRE